MAGLLYLVATPIGNLEDITYRAVRVLGEADLIACEDTRQTRKLLDHYEHPQADRQLPRAQRGGARRGTRRAHAGGRDRSRWSPTPACRWSPTPATGWCGRPSRAAFRWSRCPDPRPRSPRWRRPGLPTDAFHFGGFLPPKPGQRAKALEALAEEHATLIFYEAPHRILEALEAIEQVLGDRARRGGARADQDPRGVPARHGGGDPRANWQRRDAVKGEITLLIGKATAPAARRYAAARSRRRAGPRGHAPHGRHQAGGAAARTLQEGSLCTTAAGE